jgi:hypothetical protein
MPSTSSSDWVARLTWPDEPGGAVVLLKDGLHFEAGGDDPDGVLAARAAVANVWADAYRPGPADGWPGYSLAHDVALRLGATAEYAPRPPADPDVVY